MKKKIFTIVAVMSVLMLGSCKKEVTSSVEMLGAGATFPAPLYNKMFDEYYVSTKNKVNYQGIGSGGGMKQLIEKSVDFGATDAFMTDKELEKSEAEILHIPTCVGSVVIAYNLPGNPKIRLSQEAVAGIFLGTIIKWNDPEIQKENRDIVLPDMTIQPVTRSDSSGTTYVFTDYLTKINQEWAEKIGPNKSVNWLMSNVVSGKGNPGVAGLITQMTGSIGYMELAYAKQNNIAYATLKNRAGNWVDPTLESTTFAAGGNMPEDTRVSITDTEVENGYPIATFTWLIFYKEQNYNGRTLNQAEQLVRLLNWIVTDGQLYNEALDYAKLPLATVEKAKAIFNKVTYNGEPLRLF